MISTALSPNYCTLVQHSGFWKAINVVHAMGVSLWCAVVLPTLCIYNGREMLLSLKAIKLKSPIL